MKSFRQYITEVQRYQDGGKHQGGGNEALQQFAWDWTVGPFWDILRLSPMLDGAPAWPPVVIDQYPWDPDSLGTWQSPPEGWRLKDPLKPVNDPDNWYQPQRPGKNYFWNPGPSGLPGRGKWMANPTHTILDPLNPFISPSPRPQPEPPSEQEKWDIVVGN